MIISKPVTILSGFLGAGKTTFLNVLIKTKTKTRYAIIENEIGKEGIDGELIVKPEDGIVEMNNGCLCCSLNDNLYDILNELNTRAEEFDELVIETTGIADPAGVAEPFFVNADIKKAFPLKRVITLIDAELIEDQLQETEEAIKQIVFSDALVVNKTALVDKEYLANLKNILSELNPFASIFFENESEFPIDEILAIERDQDDKSLVKVKSSPTKLHKHGNITALSFVFEEPFDIKELQMRLYAFLVFESKDLYRMKGVFYGHAIQHKIILQSVGKNLSVVGGKAWQNDEKKQSKMVIIGKNLKSEFFYNLLKSCLEPLGLKKIN
jgi:G3E family GTPase